MKFPWKETPILYGEDARANAEALEKEYQKACKRIKILI